MLQKVVDYKLLYKSSPDALTEEVTQAIKEGWVPSGAVVPYDGGIIQAVVKFE